MFGNFPEFGGSFTGSGSLYRNFRSILKKPEYVIILAPMVTAEGSQATAENAAFWKCNFIALRFGMDFLRASWRPRGSQYLHKYAWCWVTELSMHAPCGSTHTHSGEAVQTRLFFASSTASGKRH